MRETFKSEIMREKSRGEETELNYTALSAATYSSTSITIRNLVCRLATLSGCHCDCRSARNLQESEKEEHLSRVRADAWGLATKTCEETHNAYRIRQHFELVKISTLNPLAWIE